MFMTHNENLASITFQLEWEKNGVHHTDALHAPRVNFWRDLLRSPLGPALTGRWCGERVEADFAPGQATGLRRSDRVHRIPLERVNGRLRTGAVIVPRYGRFYPAGILGGLPGIFPGAVTPFRCTGVDEAGIHADFNHVLADVPLHVTATIEDVRPKFEERGGTCNDWIEMLLTGPGFQARSNGRPTDFFPGGALDRDDPASDDAFYLQPRLVQHIDDAAIGVVTGLYRRLVPPGARVLDLMGSWDTHLPEDVDYSEIVGLGMNRVELEANHRLTRRIVHDLNRDPRLPFENAAFDAVVCTVSVEYLTDPLAVFAEVARVLAPGGIFVVTFSNRWFAPKAIRIWPELHEFERPGLVLEYFLRTEGFSDLGTYSLRGLPRPETDKYYPDNPVADPVFAVWGYAGAGRER
jgi:SAM-dependent methyltransferase